MNHLVDSAQSIFSHTRVDLWEFGHSALFSPIALPKAEVSLSYWENRLPGGEVWESWGEAVLKCQREHASFITNTYNTKTGLVSVVVDSGGGMFISVLRVKCESFQRSALIVFRLRYRFNQFWLTEWTNAAVLLLTKTHCFW